MAFQCHRFWMSIQFFIGVIAKVCVAIAKLNFFGFMDFPIFTSFWFCIIRKTISRYHGFPILNYRCFHTTSLVVVNIYFSPSWVLKSNVFDQNSTVFKWKQCILRIHPLTGCQKVSKSDFQSEFCMLKILNLSDNLFVNEEY